MTGDFVNDQPKDEWWKAGCPVCSHDDLDVHFHGGVSCPECGWEGEIASGGQLLGSMPSNLEIDEQWPDTLPWGESEQAYYRTASDDWEIGNNPPEWDGSDDRYPWVLTNDDRVLVGPEGGSHEMIEWHFGLPDIFVEKAHGELRGGHFVIYDYNGGDPADDLEERVQAAAAGSPSFLRDDNMPGNYEDWMGLRQPKETYRIGSYKKISKLSGFYFWSKSLHDLAEEQRERLKEQAGKIKEYPFTFDEFSKLLDGIPDQGFKIMPWAAREFKTLFKNSLSFQKGFFPGYKALEEGSDEYKNQMREYVEAANQVLDALPNLAKDAAKWAEYAKTYNLPLPDMNDKSFTSQEMARWCGKMYDAEGQDPRTWKASVPVYTFPDGWYIAQVGAEDLPKEGKIMQHCVGGSNYVRMVENNDLAIFSLREPNGQPHATLSLETPPEDITAGPDDQSDSSSFYQQVLEFPEIYGKQDRAPEREYQTYIERWFDHLNQLGWDPEHTGEPPEPEEVYEDHYDGPYWVNDLDDLDTFAAHVRDGADDFMPDEDPQFDEYNNTMVWYNPRHLESQLGDLDEVEPYLDLLREFLGQVQGELEKGIYAAPYTVNEAIEHIQDLWMLAHVAGDQTYGDMPHIWNAVAPALLAELEKHRIVQPKAPTPQRPAQSENLFDPSGYQAPQPQPTSDPVIDHMITYVQQLTGASLNWTEPSTTTIYPDPRGQRPEDIPAAEWNQSRPTQTRQVNRGTWDPGGLQHFLNRAPQAQYQPAATPPPVFSHRIAAATTAQRAFDALHSEGGFSLQVGGSPPPPGYYVAEDHTQMGRLDSMNPLTIEKYMEQYADLVRKHPGMFYGGWVNGHGEVYLETSWAFDYLDQAIEAAEKYHELAIWDGFLDRELLVKDLLAEREAVE